MSETPAPTAPATMQWYVVHAYSQYENSVKKALTERIKRAGLEAKFGQILVPTEEVMEIKDGVKRMTERKFFPGYVLVQMAMDEETWHLVKSTPKVMGFIGGTPDKPAPISEKEAKRILNQVEESVEKPKPKTLYEPGEGIRVTDGPFADFSGVVEEVRPDKGTLKVAITIFGRSTSVEMELVQVEKM